MKELENKIGNKAFSNTAAAVAALAKKVKISNILAQGGSEVTVNPQASKLALDLFKGKSGTAAIKLHAAWSLNTSSLAVSSITPAVASERNEISCPYMNGKPLICDAGYPSQDLFQKLQDQGAFMLFNMRSSLRSSVLSYKIFSDGKYSESINCDGEKI